MRALIVDDDPVMAEALAYNLAREGYTTRIAPEGTCALVLLREEPPDLVLLEMALEGVCGTTLCRQMRERTDAAILFLSARAGEADRLAGLESGADDYVTKPASMRELLARIRSVRRRRMPAISTDGREVRVGTLRLRVDRREACNRGRRVRLSTLDFALLHFLALHPEQPFSPEALRNRIWGEDAALKPQKVAKRLRRLREQIEADPASPRHLVESEDGRISLHG